MLYSEVITELSALDPVQTEWDQLAVANRLPLMSPACVTAWWRHLSPPGAEPRIVAVREGEKLVGLAPFYVIGRRWGGGSDLRLPGIELAGRLAPLAEPGREPVVARALGRALADSNLRPDLLTLEGMPLNSDWAPALSQAWPGRVRPASRRYQVSSCPSVSLSAGSFDRWLSAKSWNFRREMRRLRRQFVAAGGTTRSSTLETLQSDVDLFARLHVSRWEGRGGSHLAGLGARLPAVLNDIGQTLLNKEGRFRMRILEVEGEPASAQLFLAAGDRVLYVNGGWDERFAKLKPSMLGILDVIEEAFERGETDVDLGLEEQHYKQRFADGSDPVAWTILIPAGTRLPWTLLHTAPKRGRAAVRQAVKARLSEKQLRRVLTARERLRARGDSRATARKAGDAVMQKRPHAER
jgi:CelD/BcsL family acetyltransferase involved in cellulose biosynthesis